MAQRRRWKLSAEQRSDLWKRWKTGESLHAIGRALGKEHHVIHFLLARHGGIAPPVRRRCLRALTLAEREDISRGIASGLPIREIAKGLKRTVATVSREVARHGQAWDSALRPKVCLLATHRKLQEIVASKLMQDWSPQQISGWLKQHHPDDESLRVSHETIYRSLFIQARGSAETGVGSASAIAGRIRRSRHASIHGHSQGRIVECRLPTRKTCGKSKIVPFPAIGGRSIARGAQQPRGHAGRASFALLHAGEGAR